MQTLTVKFRVSDGARADSDVSLRDLNQFTKGARSSFPSSAFTVQSESTSPSRNHFREAVFVNGVLPNPAALVKGIQSFAQEISGDFTVIVNKEESGLFSAKSNSVVRALLNVARGLFSTQQGLLVESEAVTALKKTIERVCGSGKTVDIFAHSQGALITSNALCSLARNAKWWDEFKDRIQVKAFGGAGFRWPDGANVKLFEHENDPVPKISRLAYGILRRIKSHLAKAGIITPDPQYKVAPHSDTFRIKLKSVHSGVVSHDIRCYLKKLHIFWQLQGDQPGLSSSSNNGEMAATQFSNEQFTPRYFTRLLSDRFKAQDRTFLENFIKSAEIPSESYRLVLNLARRFLNRLEHQAANH